MQKEFENKLTKLELKIWDTLESGASNDLASNSLKTVHKRLELFDEKLNKQRESIKEIAFIMMKFQVMKLPEKLKLLQVELSLFSTYKEIQSQSPFEAAKPIKVKSYQKQAKFHQISRISIQKDQTRVIVPQALVIQLLSLKKTLRNIFL